MKRETTLVRRRNGYLSRDCHAQERAERAARHLVNQLPLEIPGLPVIEKPNLEELSIAYDVSVVRIQRVLSVGV